jgi:molybdopterin molybdotransferase
VNLRSVDEHRRAVVDVLAMHPARRIPVEDAFGRVLAADLLARIPLPPFDNSAMDGYAVRSIDVATASPTTPVLLRVVADIPAGRMDRVVLPPRTAARIMTGAPIPGGADAVVPVEGTDGGLDHVAIGESAREGRHVRRSGEEIAASALVARAGVLITEVHVGLLSALGETTVSVYPAPRVLVVSAGDELVAPGQRTQAGQIYASNGAMLAAAVRACGAEPVRARLLRDDPAAFIAEIDRHVGDIEVIVTAGGISAGAYEVVKTALAGRGVEFVSVAMRPGMPQGVGCYAGVPVAALPGNPVAAWMSFEVFVRPALRRAMRHPVPDRPVVEVTLGAALSSNAGRRQFIAASYHESGHLARPLTGPHGLPSLATASCLLDIAEDVTHLPAGADARAWLLR